MEYRSWAEGIREWALARGLNVVLMGSVPSTNDLGLAALDEVSGPLEAWIFAHHQRAGRGRFDRSWASPAGAGVYATTLLALPPAVVPALPLLVGVALCEGLASLGCRCRLKWPNDILSGGAKLGGVLIQSRVSADRARVVAGFGVNYSQAGEEPPAEGATCLRRALPESNASLSDVTVALCDAVDRELDRLRGSEAWNPSDAVRRWSEWTVHDPGDPMTVTIAHEIVEGEFGGVSDEGHLRLMTVDGERLVAAGDVALSEASG